MQTMQMKIHGNKFEFFKERKCDKTCINTSLEYYHTKHGFYKNRSCPIYLVKKKARRKHESKVNPYSEIASQFVK